MKKMQSIGKISESVDTFIGRLSELVSEGDKSRVLSLLGAKSIRVKYKPNVGVSVWADGLSIGVYPDTFGNPLASSTAILSAAGIDRGDCYESITYIGIDLSTNNPPEICITNVINYGYSIN